MATWHCCGCIESRLVAKQQRRHRRNMMALLTLGTTWSFGVVIEHRETRPTLIEHRIQTSGHCLGSCASVLKSWGNQTGDGMVVALFQIQAGARPLLCCSVAFLESGRALFIGRYHDGTPATVKFGRLQFGNTLLIYQMMSVEMAVAVV